jgi:hypothetical protein
MTYLEAAITVLLTSRRPLTTAEIMERITRDGLVTGAGRTPEATLSAALYKNLGKDPLLRREAKQGRQRAVRGTVRWTLSHGDAAPFDHGPAVIRSM